MWTMEDVMSELNEGEGKNERGNGLPPGFRFHPTDEELITFYLASKVYYNTGNNHVITPVHIAEVDLNRCEPWDLPERAKMGEREWYLYSLRDRKYPTGLRTNRATGTGYWKATGKDRQIHATSIASLTGAAGHGGCGSGMLIGMKKTLVFYQGRAPRGVKTRWVMHEYRLDGHFSSFRLSSKEEWVICRIFHKHGGEKKASFHPPPPPLSPFLRCLPPLWDAPSSSSLSTTSMLHYSPKTHYPNYDPNALLNSLLSNPLPNFSALTDPNTTTSNTLPATQTASTTTAASAAMSLIDQSPHSILFKSINHQFSDPKQLTCLTVSTGNTGYNQSRSMQQQYRHSVDKIIQIPNQSDNYQHYSCDEMDANLNGYTTAVDDDYDNDNDDDDTVGFDMSSSVAALDRLLNPHHVYFPAESWPFHC